MATKLGRVRAHPVLGQLRQPARRHQRLHTELSRTEPDHLRDLVQRLDHRRSRPARRRALAPPLQVRPPRVRRHLQELIQHVPLPHRQQPLQHTPQPSGGVVADLGHQPGQRAHAWKQHLPLPQPPRRIGEDRLRAITRCPRAGRHPRPQLRLGRRELPQPIHLTDLPLMIQLRLGPLGIPLHQRGIAHPELLSDEVQHRHRHIEGILQERPEPADSHQLQAEPELHVVAATAIHQRTVLVIEEEHPLQITLRHSPHVPAEGRRLIIRQELNRHTPQRRAHQHTSDTESLTVTRSAR